MKEINLRDFYPELYKRDQYVIVPDDVLRLLCDYESAKDAHRMKVGRNKAYYSLDYGDHIELKAIYTTPSPADMYECKENIAALYDALYCLPEKQRRRIYAHYILGVNKSKIAQIEGVDERAIRIGITRGLRNMQKILKIRQ